MFTEREMLEAEIEKEDKKATHIFEMWMKSKRESAKNPSTQDVTESLWNRHQSQAEKVDALRKRLKSL
jgi:hypothetical protein